MSQPLYAQENSWRYQMNRRIVELQRPYEGFGEKICFWSFLALNYDSQFQQPVAQ